jgi:hypothetical protein
MKQYNTSLASIKSIFRKVNDSLESKYPYRFSCKFCKLIIQSQIPNPFDSNVAIRFSPMSGKSDKGKYCNGISIKAEAFNPSLEESIFYTENHKNTAYIDSESIPGEEILFFASIPTTNNNLFVVFMTIKKEK